MDLRIGEPDSPDDPIFFWIQESVVTGDVLLCAGRTRESYSVILRIRCSDGRGILHDCAEKSGLPTINGRWFVEQ